MVPHTLHGLLRGSTSSKTVKKEAAKLKAIHPPSAALSPTTPPFQEKNPSPKEHTKKCHHSRSSLRGSAAIMSATASALMLSGAAAACTRRCCCCCWWSLQPVNNSSGKGSSQGRAAETHAALGSEAAWAETVVHHALPLHGHSVMHDHITHSVKRCLISRGAVDGLPQMVWGPVWAAERAVKTVGCLAAWTCGAYALCQLLRKYI